MARSKKTFDFEQNLLEIEQLVEKMEDGDLSLEDSLKAFEEGIKKTRECQQALSKAEQKVQQLIEKNGEVLNLPFADAEQEDFYQDYEDDDEI